MNIFQSVVLAIVEGITEFLPISSTGHMVIASSLMGIANNEFTKTFTVAIQLGAILSVVVLYFKRFFQSVNFYLKLIVGFIPAAILGLLLDDFIDAMLGTIAKKLRMLGFDCKYDSAIDDDYLILDAKKEGRIIITKDTRLAINAIQSDVMAIKLKTKTEKEQIVEIARKIGWKKFDLHYCRCSLCKIGRAHV